MNRVFSILAAFGILALAAVPAWAHHYHSGHYSHGYYGHYYNSYCNYYISQGDAWEAQGNYDNAIADYSLAIANDPNCAGLRPAGQRLVREGRIRQGHRRRHAGHRDHSQLRRGLQQSQRCLGRKNEYDKAIADDNQALAIDPSFTDALISRSAIWFNKGEYDKAIADDNQALAIDPSLAQAYDYRGSLEHERRVRESQRRLQPGDCRRCQQCRFTTTTWRSFRQPVSTRRYRDGKKAFENASKAYQLTNGNNANGNFSVLASVYAENGDFAKALEWQAKAIDLTKSSEMKQRYLARVELFKQGKPFRMDPEDRDASSRCLALSKPRTEVPVSLLVRAIYAVNGDPVDGALFH